jgi:hypothetical protein
VVRPLPRRRKEHPSAATPPDQGMPWTAEVWTALVVPDAAAGSASCTVVAIHHPAEHQPLLLATPLALAPEPGRAI